MASFISVRGFAVSTAALLLAVACGGGGGGGGTGNKGEISIGVDLPMSGAEASNGVPTLNGVQFAVKQQNDKGGIKGFKLSVVSLDDAVNGKHDPQKGAQNVQQFTSNDKVVGMVGPFNSNVAQAEIPVANRASLAMISPANTNPCLTKDVGAAFGGCAKYAGFTPQSLRPSGKNNYFRVAGTDDHQGPAMSDYAYSVLKLKNVAVASDGETYGQGIATTFADAFKKLGGNVVLTQDFPNASQVSDFRSFITSAHQKGADGIYFGGTDSNNACKVRQQMAGIFPASTPFMGGDGIVTGQCLKDAADQAMGMYGTVAAVNADTLSDAKSVIDAFKKAYPNSTDYGAYTMPAYACAQLIINAIGKAIDANGGKQPTREQVLAQLQKTSNVSTVLGPVSFDHNGDNSQQVISVYKTDNSGGKVDWTFVNQKNYS